ACPPFKCANPRRRAGRTTAKLARAIGSGSTLGGRAKPSLTNLPDRTGSKSGQIAPAKFNEPVGARDGALLQICRRGISAAGVLRVVAALSVRRPRLVFRAPGILGHGPVPLSVPRYERRAGGLGMRPAGHRRHCLGSVRRPEAALQLFADLDVMVGDPA